LDFLSFFRSGKKKGNDDEVIEIDDAYLKDVIMNFLIAGRDTTAQMLSWCIYLLCEHQEEQDKVFEEVMGILESVDMEGKEDEEENDNEFDRMTKEITYEEVKSMKYTKAVLMETLRLYPSVPKEGKWASKPDTLPDGTEIPGNCYVCFSPYVMGRDEDLWENPLLFSPQRFVDNPKPSPYIHTAFQVTLSLIK